MSVQFCVRMLHGPSAVVSVVVRCRCSLVLRRPPRVVARSRLEIVLNRRRWFVSRVRTPRWESGRIALLSSPQYKSSSPRTETRTPLLKPYNPCENLAWLGMVSLVVVEGAGVCRLVIKLRTAKLTLRLTVSTSGAP